MFHVRQGRREFVPGVHRADARRRGAPKGAGRVGAETVLLPTDDPLSRGTHRRSLAVRLSDLALSRRSRGEGFLRLQSFERFRRVRGVAWFERGDRQTFPLTRNPTSLGCWRLRFKSGRTHLTSGSKPIWISLSIADRWFESVRRGDEEPSTRTWSRKTFACERRVRSTRPVRIVPDAASIPETHDIMFNPNDVSVRIPSLTGRPAGVLRGGDKPSKPPNHECAIGST